MEGQLRELPSDSSNLPSRYATARPSYYAPLLESEFPDGSQRYPLCDLTGTARRLADATGTVTDAHSLDAFGRWLGERGGARRVRIEEPAPSRAKRRRVRLG